MGLPEWLGAHWFEGLQTAGILAGLFATAYSIYDGTRTRQVENLSRITRDHREIWSELLRKPELKRVLDANVDLAASPVSPEELVFTRCLILHFASVHRAMNMGQMMEMEGLAADTRQLFSRPIPSAVWSQVRPFQQRTFVQFVESVRNSPANLD